MKRFILRSFRLICLLSTLTVFCLSQTNSLVSALSAGQEELFNNNVLYYDLGCTPGSTPSTASSATTTGGGNIKTVYMVGDSITEGARDHYGLRSKFQSRDINASISATGGSSLTYPAAGRSGLEWIENDKNKIADVDAVIIAHGTNHDPSDFEGPLKEAVRKVKNYNNQAALFWVNTDTDSQLDPSPGGEKPYTAASSAKKNQIISRNSSSLGYTVVDITSENIPLASDGIHPAFSDNGHGKWGQFVVDTVAGGPQPQSSQAPAGGGDCVCPVQGGPDAGGSAMLRGGTNAEKIFNYLVDNVQLTVQQSAGAVGSMMLESGGNTENIDPTIVNPSSGAYGIAQWLDSRKTGLDNYARQQGGEISDLLIQAQYLVKEMKEGINAFDLNDFKKTRTLSEASKYWTDWFEGLAYSPDQQLHDDRIENGKLLIRKYGSGGGGSSTAPLAATGNCECSVDSATSVMGSKLKKLSEENGGKTQIAVSSLSGGLKGDSGGDVQMPTRSSYKIYTAYATLKAIEEGRISWSSRTSWGRSVAETMQAMIINSENNAAESLRTDSRIGDYRKVTNILQNQVGLSDKTVMGSGNAGDPAGSNSKSTANDFNKFLIALQKHKLPGVVKDGNYNKLISFMKKATTDMVSARAGIAAGVGSDTEVADKPGWATGSVDPASNDVGIVYLEGNTYVLSILTDKPYQWDGVAHIAAEVHKMMGGADPNSGSTCTGAVPGDLTATVKAYAWPTYSSSRSDPKPEYRQAYDKAVGQGQYGGGGYTDCGAFVTRVMIDSKYEPAYNFNGKGGNTITQMQWLNNNCQKVNVSSTKDLLPGDVAINSSHTYMYVGILSGFHGNSASASLGGRVPMASDYYEDGFKWYRKK